MKKLILNYKGRDSWDRPVYESEGCLYVDVDPCKGWKPNICTKYNNESVSYTHLGHAMRIWSDHDFTLYPYQAGIPFHFEWVGEGGNTEGSVKCG